MGQPQFETYVNVIHRYAMGHRAGCSHAKKHGGASTDTGYHLEPFDTADKAELAGYESGFPFGWCVYCCEDLKQTLEGSKNVTNLRL